MRKIVLYLVVFVLAFLAAPFTSAPAVAAPPAKVDLPTSSVVCINYWPDGEYLGVRFKFIPVGSPPEVYAATYRNAMIEIAAEHGRHDLVDRLMRDGVRIVDRATFEAETLFSPESLVATATAGGERLSTASPPLNYTPDQVRRPPHRGGICTCSSLFCSADVCGKWYCSGDCAGCNLCS